MGRMATVWPLILAVGRIGIGAFEESAAGVVALAPVVKGSRWAPAQAGDASETRSVRLQIENVRCSVNDSTNRVGFRVRKGNHSNDNPPSTTIVWPVMCRAESEQRNEMTCATSSGSATRPRTELF